MGIIIPAQSDHGVTWGNIEQQDHRICNREQENILMITTVALSAIGIIGASFYFAGLSLGISFVLGTILAPPIGFIVKEFIVKNTSFFSFPAIVDAEPAIVDAENTEINGSESRHESTDHMLDPEVVGEIDPEVRECLRMSIINPEHYLSMVSNDSILDPPLGTPRCDNLCEFLAEEEGYSPERILEFSDRVNAVTDEVVIKIFQHINYSFSSSVITEETKNSIITSLYSAINRGSARNLRRSARAAYRILLRSVSIPTEMVNLFDRITFSDDDTEEGAMLYSALSDDGIMYLQDHIRDSLLSRMQIIERGSHYTGIRNIISLDGSSDRFFGELRTKLIHIIIAANTSGIDVSLRNDLIKNIALGTLHCCDRDMSEATEGVERIYAVSNLEALSFVERIKEKLQEMRYHLIQEVHRRYHARPAALGGGQNLYDEYYTTRRQLLLRFIGPSRGIRGSSTIPSGFQRTALRRWPMHAARALEIFDALYSQEAIFIYFKQLINGHSYINEDGEEDSAIRIGRDPLFTMGEGGIIFSWFNGNRPAGYEDHPEAEFFGEFVLNEDYATVSDKAILHLLKKMGVFYE